MVIITNNVKVRELFENTHEVVMLEGAGYLDVLHSVRDRIHQGNKLLTHVLSGSIKPNETPYKSVAISKEAGSLDLDSLAMIESAITTYHKFHHVPDNPKWIEPLLEDFRLLDLTLIRNAIGHMG